MNTELELVLQGFASALICLAVGFHLLQYAWLGRYARNVTSRRSYPVSFSSDHAASLSSRAPAFNQQHTEWEALIALREGESQWPPIRTIEKLVTAAISKALMIDASRVVPTASLSEDLHADSLTLIEMVMILEEDFKIQISDDEAEEMRTVQQVIDYVAQALRSTHRPAT